MVAAAVEMAKMLVQKRQPPPMHVEILILINLQGFFIASPPLSGCISVFQSIQSLPTRLLWCRSLVSSLHLHPNNISDWIVTS